MVPAEWLLRRAGRGRTGNASLLSRRASKARSCGQGLNQVCKAGNVFSELLNLQGGDSCGGRGGSARLAMVGVATSITLSASSGSWWRSVELSVDARTILTFVGGAGERVRVERG